MCGIWGVFSKRKQIDGTRIVHRVGREMLTHRGPDGFGSYTNAHILLVHRRLSIIDLSGGSQPIFNEDKTKIIIFNGEIYNFQFLKSDLFKAGHTFKTDSDTEVIIHAYEEWGERCVEYLRGMFAFAIWDEEKESLFLARDRLGIKPLFYAEVGDFVYFASEMKAILAQEGIPREMDYDALASYFSLSYIPAPLTIFRHIRKLSPGHMMTVDKESIAISKYWDIEFSPDHGKKPDSFMEDFLDLFRDSVKLRMISDVPVGAFLSGGVDSGLVVAMMSELAQNQTRTFCMGFGGDIGGYFDERKLARLVSSKFSTQHREFEVQPQLENIIDDIVHAFDEPFADDSVIPSYYLSQITRENVTVSLSGLGGDEIFGGYERYLGFKLSNLYALLPHFVREKIIRRVVESLPERSDGHYTVNHLKRFVRGGSFPPGLRYYEFISTVNNDKNLNIFADQVKMSKHLMNCRQMILNLYETAPAQDPLDKIFYIDLKTYLPEDVLALTDRISMMHSLEVRVPFIDHRIVEFCATLPNRLKIKYKTKKYLLRKVAARFLPNEILTHRKQGFASPMSRWINYDLRDYILDVLSEENIRKAGVLNYQTVRNILDEHHNRKEIHDKLIWSMVMFQKWHAMYM